MIRSTLLRIISRVLIAAIVAQSVGCWSSQVIKDPAEVAEETTLHISTKDDRNIELRTWQVKDQQSISGRGFELFAQSDDSGRFWKAFTGTIDSSNIKEIKVKEFSVWKTLLLTGSVAAVVLAIFVLSHDHSSGLGLYNEWHAGLY